VDPTPWEPSSASVQNPLSQEDLLRLESERKKKRRQRIIYVTTAAVVAATIVIVAVKVR
jgi:hypothetical protein